MLPITIENINYNIPQSWDEVTVKQYRDILAYADEFDPARILSIFTGLDYVMLSRYDQTSLANQIYPLVEWMEDKLDFATLPIPTELKIGDKVVEVVQDISQESAGQNWTLQQFINGASKTKGYSDIISDSIAVMLQPRYTGSKFDGKEAMLLKPLIDDCKITEAYPVAAFFLSRPQNYGSAKLISYMSNRIMKRYRQMLASSANLDYLIRCTRSHRLIIQHWTRLAN